MKTAKKFVGLLLTLGMIMGLLPVCSAASGQTLLALGDSISTGYDLPTKERFSSIVAGYYGLTEVNHAVNGATTADLRVQVTSGALDGDIASAALITITSGGNEMIDLLCDEIARHYNARNGTDIAGDDVVAMLSTNALVSMLLPILTALENFSQSVGFKEGLEAYARDMTAILGYIRDKNPCVQVVVCSQFNPYKSFRGNPGLEKAYFEIDKAVVELNRVTLDNADVLGYVVADVYPAFQQSDRELFPKTTSMGEAFTNIHPNAEGHGLMADIVKRLGLEIPDGGHIWEKEQKNGVLARVCALCGKTETFCTVTVNGTEVEVFLTGRTERLWICAVQCGEDERIEGLRFVEAANERTVITFACGIDGTVRVFFLEEGMVPWLEAVTVSAV